MLFLRPLYLVCLKSAKTAKVTTVMLKKWDRRALAPNFWLLPLARYATTYESDIVSRRLVRYMQATSACLQPYCMEEATLRKVLRLLGFMNLQTISVRTFMQHQREHLQPSIVRVWRREQWLLFNQIKEDGEPLRRWQVRFTWALCQIWLIYFHGLEEELYWMRMSTLLSSISTPFRSYYSPA